MDRKRAALFALFSAALFGASTPASKFMLETLSPFVLAGLLYLGAAGFMLILRLRQPGKWSAGLVPRDRRNRLRLAGACFFGGLLGPVLLIYGLSIAKAASVALWLNLETVATALLARFFFKEHMGRWTWLGNLGVLAAGLLLSLEGGAPALWGGLLVAAGALCWGVDNNLTALIDGISPVESTLWKGATAGSTNLLLGLLLAGEVGAGWPLALGLGALSYGLSIALYISSAQRLGAVRSQMFFSTAPLFGVVLAWAWLGEAVSPWQGGAGLLIAGSLALLLLDSHAHEHTHEAFGHNHEHRHDDGHHNHEHKGLPASTRHSHPHEHEALVHVHPHWPDLHHRHSH